MTDTTPILAIILCGVTLLALALLLLWRRDTRRAAAERTEAETCLLYTSDAADE